MAKYICTDVSLKVGGTDLSNHVKSATVSMNVDDVELTAMGATSHEHGSGLRDDSIDIEFYQDFAASSVDVILAALVGSNTGATIVTKPTSATVNNTVYTMVGIPFTYSPIDASVGDASMTKVTFKPAAGGAIVRSTI